MSNYALQLREKQKARHSYGLSEKQFKNYFSQAARYSGSTAERLIQLLESRIDNCVYRAGLAPSRRAARQIVSHARTKLNGKKVSIPSIQLKKGDKVEVKLIKDGKLSGLKPPDWIKVDKKLPGFEIINQPQIAPEEMDLNLQLIIEYYSR
jgi:small subunit ribosomal protein S4